MFVPRSRVHVIFCGAGFRPGSRATFVPAKVAKTNDTQPGLIRAGGHEPAEGSPTRGACPEFLKGLGQGLPVDESVRPRASQQASEQGKTKNSVTHKAER